MHIGSFSNRATGSSGLVTDAWGIQKVSLPYSIFHGLFTFAIPANQWFMFENATQVYTSTSIVTELGAGVLRTSTLAATLELQSRLTPRYQPNRGHLYSTSVWCPSKLLDGVREWGLRTTENGVFFRLKGNGQLYAVLVSGGVEAREDLLSTETVPGFDVEKGNVYDIQYQWRGVGNYKFFINLTEVHAFNNLGKLTALSLENPTLPASFKVTRGAADVEIHVGCVGISSENGSDNDRQPRVAYANLSRNGTNVPVISILNPLLINLQTNTRVVYPSHLTFSCDKRAIFKVWLHRNPALLTGATFAALGTGSFVQTDSPDTVVGAVAATAANTALMTLLAVINVQAAGTGAFQLDSALNNTTLVRGDFLTVTVTTTTGLCDVVVAWGEAV